jgi:hypothetical protein
VFKLGLELYDAALELAFQEHWRESGRTNIIPPLIHIAHLKMIFAKKKK